MVIKWDEGANDEYADNIEQSDAPENLFGGYRESFAWILGFCCGKANQLGASKSKSSSHKG